MLEEKLTSPLNDSLALKQLLMDVAKKKKNTTSGLRQPQWMLNNFQHMSGDGDLTDETMDIFLLLGKKGCD